MTMATNRPVHGIVALPERAKRSGHVQKRGAMSIKFRSKELSHAEASFLKWQYGFDEQDEPFERALWQAIMRAWDADASETNTRHLERLGCADAYPEEVALYVRFKSEDSDTVWNELIRRAGLSDRRTAKVEPTVDRRRRSGSA
jgi:hypothetical protein